MLEDIMQMVMRKQNVQDRSLCTQNSDFQKHALFAIITECGIRQIPLFSLCFAFDSWIYI